MLRKTIARGLTLGHIDSLELLDQAKQSGIEVIYDVGANVGTWSLLAKAVIPEARVEAFEPLPHHHDGFERNLRNVDGVVLNKVALGAQDASANLRVTGFSDASSMLPPTDLSRIDFGVEEIERVSVRVRALDGYRAEHQLPPPDLIKLDVQGYELEVLKGAPECLRAAKAIIAEVGFVEYYRGQCLFHEVVAHLAQYGLLLSSLSVNTALGAKLKQTDALFVRS